MSGDIENLSGDLESLSSQVGELSSDLTAHIEDIQNPHNVSKSQVGLGSVDNTSDMDKPVSTLQEQAIETAKQEAIDEATENAGLISITQSNYEALQDKNANTIYFINNL